MVVVLEQREIAKGGAIIELLNRLRELHVRTIRIACARGCSPTVRSSASVIRSTLESFAPTACRSPRWPPVPSFTVLSIAPALAEAMRRIHNGESVSALFENSDPTYPPPAWGESARRTGP